MLCWMDADDTFSPTLSSALVDHASRVFVRRYLVGRYGPLLAGSMVICAIGVALANWLGSDPVLTFAMSMTVMLPAVYFFWFYVRMPGRLAGRMSRTLDPAVRLRIDSQGVLATSGERQFLVEWSRVKSVLEQEPYFLLVLSPFAYLVVPKFGLPPKPADVLRDRIS